MKHYLLTTLLAILFTISAAAQSSMSVSGIVKDENNEPVIGASVMVKGDKTGTITNIDGKYTIKAPANGTLVVSYVGMKPLEEAVSGRSEINLTLISSIKELSEVVVVGYGTQRKINLTGAVTTVKNEQLANRPITQASQALQGLASGVFVNSGTGEAGNDQADIVIRGIGSLNSDTGPLVLVDGIEGSINSVAPSDIENVSILKDAAAASIYGTRGANGVILITTKRGQFDKPAVITYNGYTGFSQPTILPDMVLDNKTYLEKYREAAINCNHSTKNVVTDALIDKYGSLPSTNYMDVAFKKHAPIQSHEASISGGSKSISYYASLGYLYQDGLIKKNNDYNRINVKTNLDAKITSRLKASTTLAYYRSFANLTPKEDNDLTSNGGKGSIVFSGAVAAHPFIPVYTQSGFYATLPSDMKINTFRPSIQGVLDNETGQQHQSNFIGNVSLQYELLKGLMLKGTIGINDKFEENMLIRKEFYSYSMDAEVKQTDSNSARNVGSKLYFRNKRTTQETDQLQLDYSGKYGKHELKAIAGFQRQSWRQDNSSNNESIFASTDLVILGTGTIVQSGGTYNNRSALASFYGRANYSYDTRYLLEANLRRDASSRFGASNRWGTFPSFSGGWVVSNEKFWNDHIFNYLKLRGSWGILGSEPSDKFAYLDEFGVGYGYVDQPGGAIKKVANPDLKWEQTTSTDFGLNAGFFKNKLSVEFDWFNRHTRDILVELDNMMITGVSSTSTYNAASMENRGWEATVTYNNNIGKLKFKIGANVTNVKNKILTINPDLSANADQYMVDRADNIWWIRGYPINSMYGFKYDGVFKTQDEVDAANASKYQSNYLGVATKLGDMKYYDYNKDGKITTDDQYVVGNRNPEWLYGANIDVEYRGFEFSALIQGIGDAYVNLARDTGPFQFAGLPSYWLNAWSPQNPNSNIPALWIDRTGVNGQSVETAGRWNTFWMQNMRYCRLKNIQLAYNFPQRWLANTFIKKARIYVNGQNLLTFTTLRDYDPERDPLQNNATATLPQSKTITVGCNLNF